MLVVFLFMTLQLSFSSAFLNPPKCSTENIEVRVLFFQVISLFRSAIRKELFFWYLSGYLVTLHFTLEQNQKMPGILIKCDCQKC